MMTPMMRKDGTGDPAACLVSAAHVVENSAARLEESAARGRKCEQGKPIRVGECGPIKLETFLYCNELPGLSLPEATLPRTRRAFGPCSWHVICYVSDQQKTPVWTAFNTFSNGQNNGNRTEHSANRCRYGSIARSPLQALSKNRDFCSRGSA